MSPSSARTLGWILALLLSGGIATAQPDSASVRSRTEDEWFFYQGRDFGSEELVNPLRLILNGGYGILQLDNREASPWDIDYSRGWDIVWTNLLDPFGAIQSVGWDEFIKREVIPFSVDSKGGQYWPNYTLHLIGGGMSYRMMVEWYRWHEYPHPKAWAGTTIFAYHLLNEVVENYDVEKWTVDPVADMLIFNPIGILLFEQDGFARFFARRLNLTDWSYQIAYDFGQERWVNNGQNFAMKLALPGTDRWRLFYHMGTHAEIGLSYRLANGDDFSFGAGLIAKNLVPTDGSFRTVDLARSAGLWWDRDGSLLASMDWAEGKGYRARLNVYPGFVHIGRARPGAFAILGRDYDWTFGISMSILPAGPAHTF